LARPPSRVFLPIRFMCILQKLFLHLLLLKLRLKLRSMYSIRYLVTSVVHLPDLERFMVADITLEYILTGVKTEISQHSAQHDVLGQKHGSATLLNERLYSYLVTIVHLERRYWHNRRCLLKALQTPIYLNKMPSSRTQTSSHPDRVGENGTPAVYSGRVSVQEISVQGSCG